MIIFIRKCPPQILIQTMMENEIQQLQNAGPHIQTVEQMNSFIQNGYYDTICLVHQTDNFHISQTHKIINESSGQYSLNDLVFIGNIVRLEQLIVGDIECMKASFKTCYDSRPKLILLRKSDYRKHFIKNFNRMLKNKNERYIFTSMKAGIYLNQVYFMIQPSTYLLQVQESIYNIQLKPIEKIFQFKFSNINLGKVYGIDEMDKSCKDGFIISQIRQRFQNKEKQTRTIVGMVEIVEKGFQKNSRNRRNLVLWVTQTLFENKNCTQIGRCKLILRYSLGEEENITKFIQNNEVYLFAQPDLLITENVNIMYSITINNGLKNHCIFKLSQNQGPISFIDWQSGCIGSSSELYIPSLNVNLQQILIANLLEKNINRNYVKLHLSLIQVEIIYAVIKCIHCGVEEREVRQQKKMAEEMDIENPERDGQVRMEDQNSNFFKVKTQNKNCKHALNLQLWGMIRAADQSGICMVSLEHRDLIKFLGMESYLQVIEKVVLENGKGMPIMNSNKPKNSRNVAQILEDPLISMKTTLRYRYAEKSVIGFARTQLDKTFREGLSENEQLDYQTSFQNTKKYLQHKKIFPNGIIEKKGEQLYMVPYIKAVAVLD